MRHAQTSLPLHPAAPAPAAFRAGATLVPTPGFSGHDSDPAVVQEVRQNKSLSVVVADSRPLPVGEVGSGSPAPRG